MVLGTLKLATTGFGADTRTEAVRVEFSSVAVTVAVTVGAPVARTAPLRGKVAEVWPAGTVTDAGTDRFVLELASATVTACCEEVLRKTWPLVA